MSPQMADHPMPDAPLANEPAPKGPFANMLYHIIQNDTTLPPAQVKELEETLDQNGAQKCQSLTDAPSGIPIDFGVVTHIIAQDIDFPGYDEADRMMITVVKPEWVYKTMETGKVQPPRPYTPDPRLFFSNVCITTADLPAGDKEAIAGGVIAMGGTVCSTLRKDCTHIVALNMQNEKCRVALQKRLPVKIVLPHWFDDCLKLRRRIDEKPYLLTGTGAEIEHKSEAEPVPIPQGPDLSYSHAHTNGPMALGPPQLAEKCNILNGERVLLGEDLMLSERQRATLQLLITQSNGTIAESVMDAQIYVGQWRDGDDYLQASRRGIIVGNLTWLYWMFAHRKRVSPLGRLLHYPLVRGGHPAFKDKLITVSNYGGDARLYLESLIDAIGGRFTKSMKAENTHLITARAHSEKYDAAKEWNIHIVNHLWLEDSYAEWKEMTMSDPRYTHFPKRTNLMEVVGQTRLKHEVLEQFYVDPESQRESDSRRGGGSIIKSTGRGQPVPKKFTSNGTRTQAIPGANEATPSRPARTEEPAPPSTGRKAKEAAAARLHAEIMPDLALYQKEQKRKGGVLGGGRKRRSSVSSVDNGAAGSAIGGEGGRGGIRRTASPVVDGNCEAPGASTQAPAAKKAKKTVVKPTVFLLITAYVEWTDLHKQDKEKKQLLELGIKCVDEASKCTHLAAPKLARTVKTCVAIARAPVVVLTDWIEACLKAHEIVDTTPYLLKDPENERRFNMKLSESLELARANKQKLLAGFTIFCTEKVHGTFEVCKSIVEANGGVCISWKKQKRPANVPRSGKYVLLSSEYASDRAVWTNFRNMCGLAGIDYKIYKADWLLDLAMRQKIDWSSLHELGLEA